MIVTIKDVAKRAGVSTATVSMVINDKNVSISKETKEKVKLAVKELNYKPNRIAVALVTKRTNTLGLIIPDNSNLFFASLSKEIEISARKFGYRLIYCNSDNDFHRDIENYNIFQDKGVDGIILVTSQSSYNDNKIVEIIKKSNIPMVTVDRLLEDVSLASILVNHRKGGYIATKYLIGLGHRCIGCITGPLNVRSAKDRLDGYCDALSEAGITFDSSLIYEGEYSIKTGIDALPYLMGKGVTSIFAFADMIAYGVYKEVKNFNLTLPEDLSVVGFDDIFFSDIINPPLTTVFQPVADMGMQAVKSLADLINNDNSDELKTAIVFDPVLMVRGSCKSLNRE